MSRSQAPAWERILSEAPASVIRCQSWGFDKYISVPKLGLGNKTRHLYRWLMRAKARVTSLILNLLLYEP